MLEEIRELQTLLLKKQRTTYKRYFFDSFDFDKMSGIIGARGVGKTTFLLQYLKENALAPSKKLYISADSIKIDSLFELAKTFQNEGGKLLIIDEIHKYTDFENELKKIYDFLELQVIFSGSSALRIDHSKADLSRRAIVFEVEGLSFREFIELKLGTILPSFTLEELLSSHVDIAYELLEKFDLALFGDYLHDGYYPYYFDKSSTYKIKLAETINTVIEVDIPSIFNIEYQNIRTLKKLLLILCESVPYTPNINELLSKMGMGTDYRSLYRYLDYLHKAKILTLMRPVTKGDNIFAKPEKIYFNNTNLHYAYCNTPNIGTIREVFFKSMLFEHTLNIPKKGDFLVDNTYTFEIGGKNKNYKQIKDIPSSYIVADDIEIGSGNKIPLWLFGFLY
ncbi:MAG: AAA family ATPase [Campylobacterota bacterium]|nr:AAA family ATPase [Campylobacterota bacterium]